MLIKFLLVWEECDFYFFRNFRHQNASFNINRVAPDNRMQGLLVVFGADLGRKSKNSHSLLQPSAHINCSGRVRPLTIFPPALLAPFRTIKLRRSLSGKIADARRAHARPTHA